jgi:hypothetical protein
MMKSGLRITIMNSSKTFLLVSALLVSSCLTLSLPAAEPKADAASTSQPKQKEFNNPKEAADALVQAAEVWDVAALSEILGPESKDLISSEDPVKDKDIGQKFAAKAKEKMAVGADEKNANRVIVTVGNDDFPLAIPIVKQKGKWIFDTKAGREEILARRIGSNELDAIAICRGFDDAQHEYALEKHDDSKVNQYAQKIVSSPGKKDGLAWQTADGKWDGPIGENVAKAIEQGYTKTGQPYHGYYYKILSKQGPNGPLGAMDFVIDGAMIGGFALAASPAQYGVTGIESFIVGANGVVYQKDLGKDGLKAFQDMDKFDPDKTWKETDDEWPDSDDVASAQ